MLGLNPFWTAIRARPAGAPAPAPSSTPAWASAVAVNEWVELANSADSLLPLSMSAPRGNAYQGVRLDAYNGLVRVGNKLYGVNNSGHDDYWGNEVTVFDTEQDAPAWALLRASAASSQMNGVTSGDGINYLPNGEPAGCHTYDHTKYVPQGGSAGWIVRVTAGAMVRSGGRNDTCIVYDIATNSYLPAGTVKHVLTNSVGTPTGINVSNPCVWSNEATGDLYAMIDWTVYKRSQATGDWVSMGGGAGQYGHTAIAVTDTTRGRAIIFGGNQTPNNPCTYTFADEGTSPIAGITLTGTDAAQLNVEGVGACYEPLTDTIYARPPSATDGTMLTVNPATFAVSSLSTTGGTGIPASTNSNGDGIPLFSKLHPVTFGSKVFLVLVPHGRTNARALRVR